VKSLAVTVGVLKAVVKGNRAYQVRLKAVAGRLEGDCSCPVGQDGDFCKHCVAVGLAWLGSGAKPEANLKDGGRGATVGDLRSYLAGLEKSELVDLVMGKTQDDDRWRRSLTLRAAGKGGGRADLDVYKNALDEALDADDFIGWDEVFDYATGVEDAVSSIAGLLKKGRADEVIELCEYAIAGVERAMENVDDSDGSMGTILARRPWRGDCSRWKWKQNIVLFPARPKPIGLSWGKRDSNLTADWPRRSGPRWRRWVRGRKIRMPMADVIGSPKSWRPLPP
jgi:hypothetical protein